MNQNLSERRQYREIHFIDRRLRSSKNSRRGKGDLALRSKTRLLGASRRPLRPFYATLLELLLPSGAMTVTILSAVS